MGRTETRQDQGDGIFKRAWRRFASSNSELDDQDRRRDAAKAGAMPISRCGDRTKVDLYGDIVNVTINPNHGAPSLEAQLRDGSGTVTLVWLGRRKIPGIEPGRAISVGGRLCCRDSGERVMFNPRYELR